MTTMKLTAAERRQIIEDRAEAAELRKARLAQRDMERKMAAETKKRLAKLEAEKLAKAKIAHAERVALLYAEHVKTLALATAARLKTLAGGLVAFTDSFTANNETVTVQNVHSLEDLLTQAGQDPKATFKAPEFNPNSRRWEAYFISMDMASPRQSGKTDALRQLRDQCDRELLPRKGA